MVALFDPAAEPPVTPKPNDLAIDPATGLLNVPDAPEDSEADRAFHRYLRTLDGFPTSATATATFSEPLDPATLTVDTVRVLDITDPAHVSELHDGVTLSWNAEKERLEVKAPWQLAHRYAVAVRAGPEGVRSRNGDEAVGSPAFVLLRAKNTLVTCEDLAAPDCHSATSLISGEDADARAVTLERARRWLEPGLDYLDARGITREELAVAWSFRTPSQPLVTFDPANQIVPFPNDALMQGGKVNLPARPDDDAQLAALKAMLNTLDGFSTTASLLTELGDDTGATSGRIDAGSLDPSQFLLVNLSNPNETVEVIVTCRACGRADEAPGEEPDQLALKPARPLRGHTPWALFWLKGARGLDGRAVAANPTFALARLDTPLEVDGVSQLDGVDDETAARLEPLRQRLHPLFAVTDARGIAREDILLAWSFRTLSVSEPLAALTALPATAWNLSTQISGNLTDVDLSPLALASAISGVDFHSEIRAAKEGEFSTGLALDPTAEEVLGDGTTRPTEGAFTDALLQVPRREALRFILFLPKTAKYPDGRIPILIFQHGLGGGRRHASLLANTAAKHGYALVAIDAPLHGDRSFCQSDNECVAGTSCLNHRCPGGYRSSDPTGTPDISGNQFVSISNPFYTRDHFRQAVIDLAQLVRVVQDTDKGIGAISVDDPSTPPPEKLDVSEIGFVGQSLGGIIGALATAAIPDLPAATLNVPGGSQTDIILRATDPAFEAIKAELDASLEARGMTPGSQRYEEFLDTARWIMDPADPQNFGRHFIAEPLTNPLTGSPMPRKYVFVSWTEGDPVVPNYCTDLLLQSIDVGTFADHFQSKQYPGGDHAFLLNVLNGPFAQAAQEDAVGWVDR